MRTLENLAVPAVCAISVGIVLGSGRSALAEAMPTTAECTNSLGMKFLRIGPGMFKMGRLNHADGLSPGYEFVVDGGDWDEKPVHSVTISCHSYIQQTEVAADQHRQFDPTCSTKGTYATGMPIPPHNEHDGIGPFVGIHAAVLAHNHSPGFLAMPNGIKKSESTWVNRRCEGTATQWDRDGKIMKQIELINGILVE